MAQEKDSINRMDNEVHAKPSHGMFDYSEMPRVKRSPISFRGTDMLKAKQVILWMIVGLISCIIGFIVTGLVDFNWGIKIPPILYSLPVCSFLFVWKRQINIPLFTFLGYAIGYYIIPIVLAIVGIIMLLLYGV